jgi:phosphoribosyl-ATP pyrophosphohydrolase
MGFHKKLIQRGELGEISKVIEEAKEFEDAMEQNLKILAMWELSDIYGALELVAEKFHLTMEDLKNMSEKNKELFKSNER